MGTCRPLNPPESHHPRLPEEPESAALGAALQAGAVHSGVPVADFVAAHEPPVSEHVVRPDPAAAAAYRTAYARHRDGGAALFARAAGAGGGDAAA